MKKPNKDSASETPNQRFKAVRLALKNCSQQKFAQFLKVSPSSVQKIEQGDIEVSDEMKEKLEVHANVSPDYVSSGKLPMFIDGTPPEVVIENEDAPWKNEAIQNLKSEVQFYRNLLMQFAGGNVPGFLHALNKTALADTGS